MMSVREFKHIRIALGAVLATTALAAVLASGPRAIAQSGTPDYAALMAAPDRSDADRQADKRRDPVPFLAFAGLKTGMKVFDLGAGAGYSTELDARVVGPTGVVYGQNPPGFPDRAVAALKARADKFPQIKPVSRPFDDAVPGDVHDLDAITFLFFYHDTTYMEVDRAKMGKTLLAALKPGGVLVLADHAAAPGSDLSVGKTLHRIDEQVVRRELAAAGFKLVAEGAFWRHKEDPHDFTTRTPTGPVDEFALKFQKP